MISNLITDILQVDSDLDSSRNTGVAGSGYGQTGSGYGTAGSTNAGPHSVSLLLL